MNQAQISKKRNFVANGVFYAEFNELLMRTLAEGSCHTHPHGDHHSRHANT